MRRFYKEILQQNCHPSESWDPASFQKRLNRTRHWVPAFAGMTVFFISTSFVHADTLSRSMNQGRQAFDNGDFEKAGELFQDGVHRDSESDIANYNFGTVLYKQGKYEEAVNHLQKALLSNDPALVKKAHYNLGDAHYQLAKQLFQKDPSESKEELQKSLDHFLEVEGEDGDALDNVPKVKKALEVLKKIEQIQKQQSGDSKDQQDGQESKDGEDQQGNQGQQNQQSQQGGESGDKSSQSSSEEKFQDNGQKSGDQTSQESKDKAGSQEMKDQDSDGKNATESNQKQGQAESGRDSKDKKSQSQAAGIKPDDSLKASGQEDQKDAEGEAGDKADKDKKDGKKAGKSQGSAVEQGKKDSKDSASASKEGDSAAARYQKVNEKRAQQLLEKYEQMEEPQKLLNFYRPSGEQRNDEKDW